MSIERKIVALVRRYSDALRDCSMADTKAAMGNLETAVEAAKSHGLEDLARAVLDQEVLSSETGRRVVFKALNSPLNYQNNAAGRVEKYKEYLS